MRISNRLTGGALRFETEVRGHTLVTDLPEDAGGSDTGATPPELLVTALGTCVGVYAVNFCMKHGISTEGMVIHTDWAKGSGPARITDMSVSIELPGGVPEEKYAAFMKTVEACLIHNTLCQLPKIEIKMAELVKA